MPSRTARLSSTPDCGAATVMVWLTLRVLRSRSISARGTCNANNRSTAAPINTGLSRFNANNNSSWALTRVGE